MNGCKFYLKHIQIIKSIYTITIIISNMHGTHKISYDNLAYYISLNFVKVIGFINGMVDSGLYDNLALPLPSGQLIVEMGLKVLEYMASNPYSGMDYLQSRVLGGIPMQDYIRNLDVSNIGNIRKVLEQVFVLLSLADYWDWQN